MVFFRNFQFFFCIVGFFGGDLRPETIFASPVDQEYFTRRTKFDRREGFFRFDPKRKIPTEYPWVFFEIGIFPVSLLLWWVCSKRAGCSAQKLWNRIPWFESSSRGLRYPCMLVIFVLDAVGPGQNSPKCVTFELYGSISGGGT